MAEKNRRGRRLRGRATLDLEPVPHAGLLLRYARQMRARPTEAEAMLWGELRATGTGYRFDRQYVISTYIVDFVCRRLRLVVEVDGDIHDLPERIAYDAARSSDLEAMGFVVLRFRNEEVLKDVLAVARQIKTVAEELAAAQVARKESDLTEER